MRKRLSLACVALLTALGIPEAVGQCPGPSAGRTPSGPTGGAGIPGPAGGASGSNVTSGGGSVWAPPAAAPSSPTSGGAVCLPSASGPSSGATGAQGGVTRGSARSGGGVRRGAGLTRSFNDGQLSATSGSTATWWEWWEMNRLQYLRPHALESEPEQETDRRYAFGSKLNASYVDQMTKRVLPLIEKATHDRDAHVRSRAAMTWGRLGGRDAVPRLMDMLDDRVIHVRHCAMLGLGATGHNDAAQILLDLANDPKRARKISAHGTSIAIMGLAIGRHYGFPSLVERYVEGILETVDENDDDKLAAAAFVFDSLAPSDRVRRHAMTVARNEDFDVIARCNALMSLGKGSDGTVIPTLLTALGDGDVDVRRAAAMALSRHGDTPLLNELGESLDNESDEMARGFLMIALGEQTDDAALEVLIERVSQDDDQSMRPWAALALGINARRTGDGAACTAIHDALENEGNHDAHGAYLVACGIARDTGSVPALHEALTTSGDARERTFAAQSLALIGDVRSRDVLREQLHRESWPYAQAAIAQSLGHLGHIDDGALVVDMVRTLNIPELQASIASAASFHGSSAALEGLIDILIDKRASNEARGAALDGIGLLLADSRGLLLADLAANANYRSFPSWVSTLMGDVTL